MSPTDSDATKGLRVLLVDDETRLLDAFELYLSQSMEVKTCNSGADALELLGQEKFPVIVSDMHMPEMTGIEFIKQARKLCPDSVYIMLTASRESSTASSAFNDANVYCVVAKPCAIADLKEVITAAYAEYTKA